jgi:TPP-dependent pyruvate/acetoin dehydrogenase alpha subunit
VLVRESIGRYRNREVEDAREREDPISAYRDSCVTIRIVQRDPERARRVIDDRLKLPR